MKTQRKKLICGIIAAALAAAVFAGCTGKEPNETTANGSSTTAPEGQDDFAVTTRPLKEGDTYAINKISNKTEGDTLPGGFIFLDGNEEYQIKLYSNGTSGIRLVSVNYIEDLPEDMAVWADSASANIVLSNITAAKMQFGDPVKTTVCGFDAIMYDYDMAYYDYSDPNNTGENLKTEDEKHKGRNYYFYSDTDAYAVMFETLEQDWDEQIPNLEKFVADLQIAKN